MSAVPVVADRVMKARRESTCTLCSGLISVGQLIARCPGGLWVHCSCFIGHRHNIDVPSERPAKTTGRHTHQEG